MFTRFDRIHERDGHTHRRTLQDSIGCACIPSCGKKWVWSLVTVVSLYRPFLVKVRALCEDAVHLFVCLSVTYEICKAMCCHVVHGSTWWRAGAYCIDSDTFVISLRWWLVYSNQSHQINNQNRNTWRKWTVLEIHELPTSRTCQPINREILCALTGTHHYIEMFIATQLNSTRQHEQQLTQFVGRDVINTNTTDLAVCCSTGSVEFSWVVSL